MKKSNKKKKAKSKDGRVKKSWEDYPNGKKPTVFGIRQGTEVILDEDASHNNRDFKAHVEHLIEQFATGNIKIRVPGTRLWQEVKRDDKFTENIRKYFTEQEADNILSDLPEKQHT